MLGRLDELIRRTPAGRDRYMDFLRALSILVVVVGHWLIGMIYWRGGVIGTRSAIGVTNWAWAFTWLLQVMPIFFFVGGFSNFVTYRSSQRSGTSTWRWTRTRLTRLFAPSLIFIGVWVLIQVGLHLSDVGAKTTPFLRGVRPPGATVPFGPLWFLGLYAVVLVVAPVMIRLHERFGLAVPAGMVLGAVTMDALGFVAGLKGFRYLNVVFVMFLPHQLGFFYADGRLRRLPRSAHATMALSGLALLVLLTNPWIFGEVGERWFPGVGHYPKSLLGTDVEPISNAYPPTICFMAMAFWSIGVVMLLRERVSRWLERDGPWRFTVLVNSVIMTLFLWHMTAYLIAILLLWPLGLGHTNATQLRWWLERPIWILVPGAILLVIVAVFGRFERPAALRKVPVRAGGP
ncbi:MAG TPA: acyltransferase [Actinomycetota bacterium]|jgi:fucose 4-O-acetylase-like acetyltransferase|nr:acyltransferase [Actinomycetota bacterium]